MSLSLSEAPPALDRHDARRAVKHGLLLSDVQLSLVGVGLAAHYAATMHGLTLQEQSSHPDNAVLGALRERLRYESQRRLRGVEQSDDCVPLSLNELYVIFAGLESHERDTLEDAREPVGDVRMLIEILRCEMIRREMELGNVQAALDLTTLGKAILARVPAEQRW